MSIYILITIITTLSGLASPVDRDLEVLRQPHVVVVVVVLELEVVVEGGLELDVTPLYVLLQRHLLGPRLGLVQLLVLVLVVLDLVLLDPHLVQRLLLQPAVARDTRDELDAFVAVLRGLALLHLLLEPLVKEAFVRVACVELLLAVLPAAIAVAVAGVVDAEDEDQEAGGQTCSKKRAYGF